MLVRSSLLSEGYNAGEKHPKKVHIFSPHETFQEVPCRFQLKKEISTSTSRNLTNAASFNKHKHTRMHDVGSASLVAEKC